MNGQKDGVALIGRIALAAIFVLSGLQKLIDFTGTASMIAGAGVPLPRRSPRRSAVVIELGGGLAHFWPVDDARAPACALENHCVFCIIVVSPISQFLDHGRRGADDESGHVLKNVSMLGGFLC